LAETAGRTETEWRSGWTLVLAATAGVSLSTLPAGSIGVMMGQIEQDLGWSRTQIYSGVSLLSFIGVLLGLPIGLVIDRIGPRRVALAVILTACTTYMLMSRIDDAVWHWWLLWGMIGIAGAAMPGVWMTAVAARFSKSRGFAMAIALSGTGLANFLVPPLTDALVREYGWRGGYFGLGAIWLAVLLPLTFLFFRAGPSPRRAANDEAGDRQGLPGLTARQGFTTGRYYRLMFGAAAGTAGGVALVMNLVPILVTTGLDRTTSAWIAGMLGISTIVGRITSGWLLDRTSAPAIACVATAGSSVLPIMLLALPGMLIPSIIGVVVYGLSGGAKMGAVAYLTSRHLGQRAFATLYGAINAMVALGVGVAPLLANVLYDTTGSYEPMIWAALPILLMAALAYLTLGPYPNFEQPEETAA